MVSGCAARMGSQLPRGTFKTPITIKDVLNSRMIAYAFRLLQCRPVTRGSGALILVAAECVRDVPQSPPGACALRLDDHKIAFFTSYISAPRWAANWSKCR